MKTHQTLEFCLDYTQDVAETLANFLLTHSKSWMYFSLDLWYKNIPSSLRMRRGKAFEAKLGKKFWSSKGSFEKPIQNADSRVCFEKQVLGTDFAFLGSRMLSRGRVRFARQTEHQLEIK